MLLEQLEEQIGRLARQVLAEDLGNGDVTAALIPAAECARAQVITREDAILCGGPWFDAVFRELDPAIHIEWQAGEGDRVVPGQVLCLLEGPARALLSGERAALNLLQTLSGTASLARQYADAVAGLPTRILDTRKTIPGLRLEQKYAVRCGGCHNHRIGLFDAVLIKENHIQACGSIALAVARAREQQPELLLEVEVEDLEQLQQALAAGVDRILLDNFSREQLRAAVTATAGRAELEASGGVTLHTLLPIAETGVDFISVGALTKDVRALDLSMLFLD